MKKDKLIKELEDWLKSVETTESNDNNHQEKHYEDLLLDYDFEQVLAIDNTKGIFEYKRNGVQDYILNKLKKMSISKIRHELDLHGETIKDSIKILNKYFSNAYINDIEYIKVICGKGHNSVDNIPRIKILTQAFIKKSNIVNAACTADNKEGGVGVLKIKLKK